MPSRSGVTSAVQARQALARHVAVNIANGHPVKFAEIAVDGTAQAFKFLQQIGVGAHVFATR
jgi:hypothetical protein